MTQGNLRVVADIGGTNTRIALYDEASGEFHHRNDFVNRDFARFTDLLAEWRATLHDLTPSRACFAIAAPMSGDHIAMINCDWTISRSEVADQLGLPSVPWLNDFESNALALPHLRASELDCLRDGDKNRGKILATMGPGTGLGGATLDSGQVPHRVRPAEPGHMGLTPGNTRELALFELLLQRFDDVYAELLLSGPGLLRLYQALCEIQDAVPTAETPAEVSASALTSTDPVCREASLMFCDLLGSSCGDFVLANGAYGGLFLAGGIAPQILPLLRESFFLKRFCQKGAMAETLDAVPVYVITGADTGLIGAAHAPCGD